MNHEPLIDDISFGLKQQPYVCWLDFPSVIVKFVMTCSTMQVVPVMLKHLSKLSSVRLYVPKDLRSSDSRYSVRKAIEEVHKRYPNGLPLLDPVKDMKIKHEEFKVLPDVLIFAV